MSGGGEPSTRTFELLANETRLGIITALGDASGEAGYATLAFTDLMEAVGMEDSGQFTYHLKQLTDEFVEKKEGGYGLTLAGIRAYQAVVAHQFSSGVEVEPEELDSTCDECGSESYIWYEGGRGYVGCLTCDAILIRYPVSSDSFDPCDPRTLMNALNNRLTRDYASMRQGICPYCTGEVRLSLQASSDYWEKQDMREESVLVHAACADCAWFLYANLPAILTYSPVVSGFFEQQGVNVWDEYVWTDAMEWAVTDVDTDPIRVRGFFGANDGRLRLVVDDELAIVEHHVERTGE